MRITDLIDKLEEMKQKHGNIEVMILRNLAWVDIIEIYIDKDVEMYIDKDGFGDDDTIPPAENCVIIRSEILDYE